MSDEALVNQLADMGIAPGEEAAIEDEAPDAFNARPATKKNPVIGMLEPPMPNWPYLYKLSGPKSIQRHPIYASKQDLLCLFPGVFDEQLVKRNAACARDSLWRSNRHIDEDPEAEDRYVQVHGESYPINSLDIQTCLRDHPSIETSDIQKIIRFATPTPSNLVCLSVNVAEHHGRGSTHNVKAWSRVVVIDRRGESFILRVGLNTYMSIKQEVDRIISANLPLPCAGHGFINCYHARQEDLPKKHHHYMAVGRLFKKTIAEQGDEHEQELLRRIVTLGERDSKCIFGDHEADKKPVKICNPTPKEYSHLPRVDLRQ